MKKLYAMPSDPFGAASLFPVASSGKPLTADLDLEFFLDVLKLLSNYIHTASQMPKQRRAAD